MAGTENNFCVLLVLKHDRARTIINFSGVGINGETFDLDYINEISAAESSKSNNKNKSENNSESEDNSKPVSSDSTPNSNPNSSNSTDCESNLMDQIKLTCELGDLSEYKSLMTSSRNKPNITLEFKNKQWLVLTPLTCQKQTDSYVQNWEHEEMQLF